MSPARRLVGGAAVMILICGAGGLIGVAFPARPAFGASGSIAAGPPGSFGFYRVEHAGLLQLRAAPTSLAPGNCLDVWLGRTPRRLAHVDARVARSCVSHTRRETGVTHQVTAVTGPLMVNVCYGRDNATTQPISNCTGTTTDSAEPVEPVVANLPNPCTRSWVLTAGGTLAYHSGGSPTSCTS